MFVVRLKSNRQTNTSGQGQGMSSFGSNKFPIECFQRYFNYAYYIFLCPFAIEYDSKAQNYVSTTSKARRTITALLHIVMVTAAVLLYVLDVISIQVSQYSTLEYGLLKFIGILWVLYVLSVINIMWFQEANILKFLNSLRDIIGSLDERKNDIYICGTKKRLAVEVFLGIATLIWFLLDAIFVTYSIEQLNWEHIRLKLIRKLRIKSSFSSNQNMTNEDDYPASVCFAGISFFVLSGLNVLLTNFGYILNFLTSMSIWLVVRRFIQKQRTTKTGPVPNIAPILDNFNEISNMLTSCGNAFGILYGICCLGLIPMYALNLPLFFRKQNLFFQIDVLLYSSVFMAIVIPAADVHHMIKSIPQWIQYSFKTTTGITGYNACRQDDELPKKSRLAEVLNTNTYIGIILHQINGNNVGIDGKVFILTYRLLGSVFSVILTYAIIIVQFNTPVKWNCNCSGSE